MYIIIYIYILLVLLDSHNECNNILYLEIIRDYNILKKKKLLFTYVK